MTDFSLLLPEFSLVFIYPFHSPPHITIEIDVFLRNSELVLWLFCASYPTINGFNIGDPYFTIIW